MTNEAIIRGDIFIAHIPQPAEADHLLYGARPVVCIGHLEQAGDRSADAAHRAGA